MCFCNYMRKKYPDYESDEVRELNPDLWEYCDEWNINTISLMLAYCAGLFVVVVNAIVKILNTKMASFSRYKSLGQ